MDNLRRFNSKQGFSHSKTIATSDEKSANQRHGLVANPEIVWQREQYKSSQDLIRDCYDIIESQQAHIDRLQKDNSRKDSIIANLLNKNIRRKYNQHISHTTPPQSSEFERLSNEMMDLYNKYQKVAQQNQNYKVQLACRETEIEKLQKINRSMAEQQKLMKQEVDEVKNNMAKLKQAYQAKIVKLLAQIRRNVEENVQKSIQKRKIAENSAEKQTTIKPFITIKPNQQQLENQEVINTSLSLTTPLKDRYEVAAKKQASTQVTRDHKKSGSKTLTRISPNFIPTSFKSFPNPNQVEYNHPCRKRQQCSSSSQFSSRKSGKILGELRDVEFITDSYGDSSDSCSDISPPLVQQHNQKISINKIVSQHESYLTQQIQHPINISKIQTENHVFARKHLRVVQYLEGLSQKLKRFQNPEVDIEDF